LISTDGHTGNNSAKVDVTSYSSGDSKWYFAPVAVAPGSKYTFSDYYKSNVATNVVVQVESTYGSYGYYWLGSPASSTSSWNLFSADFTTPSDAKFVTVFHVISSVGWLQIDDVSFSLVDVVSPIAPTVNISAPVDNATVSGSSVAITANATSEGAAVAGVQFKLDGSNLGVEDTTAPYEISWDSTTASSGNHVITAVVRSTNGLSATSDGVTVNAENSVVTPPTVSVTAPAASAAVSGSAVDLRATADDAIGVAGVQFKVDGVDVGSEDTAAPYEISWDSTSVANGSHNIAAVARNTSGLSTTSDVVAVDVSNVVPPVDENNLVLNPSMEAVSSSNSQIPANWRSNSWGINTASFTYETTGHNSGRSVTANVTSYTSGDAKWYFDTVSVTPGAVYTFSDYYKSNVATEVVVMVENNSGVLNYYYLGSVATSPTSWQQYSVDYTAPVTANKITVFHLINSVGWLQIDDASFALKSSAPIAPTVNITSPSDNSTLNGTHTIIATAESQGASVSGVQFKVDGANIGSVDATSPYEAVWDTTTVSNGNHEITAVVTSSNGLNTVSSAVSVNVSNVTPPVDNDNLVLNPSVESVNPSDSQLPVNWNRDTWGVNTASFNYDLAGHTGERSITTIISSYTSGDAKWYADPVDVLPGKNYLYRDYYKSDVENHVVVAYIDASGNYSYQYIGSAPASGDWTLYEANFVIPATASKAIVFHLIDSVGYLTIDDIIFQVGVAPPAGDVILNGSLEFGASVPTGWQTSKWGTSIANFQWSNDGHTGDRSIKTTVSSYVDGDAKWFFDPINTLTPGEQYRFNVWYKTNVIPKAVVLFITADGTEHYFGMPNPQPNGSTTEWQQYSEVFLVPQDAVWVSAFLFVNENGWLQTDDYSISDYHPTGFSRPLLSLTFDDGHEDNINTALPMLNQYGFKSTQCYATTFIENDPIQATTNVLAFYNGGHEICSHSVTHPALTTLNDTDLNYELSHSKEYLESVIGQPVVNFASPYGDYNQHVNTVIDDYYGSHRTVDEGFNSIDNFDAYRLRVQNVLDTTTADQVSAWIEQAKLDKTWLILVYHRIANNDPGPYDTYTSVFQQQLDVIKDSGITVKTWQDALTEVKSQL
jgi:peptidoglycan/xylan/chitin deacetylase (PgdA/CDA1 family)